ncbi:uncharacterized protein N0V89_012255 [Didymosphaeria variabile]|uniref:SNF2 family helicase n=1 Tax=Didymosphaeria variabile TaxID=1932322 RepID=A0A9W8XA51_9PLEO|nr:uncharacterized protein N0V89_012255 [Didymosphaeria variabile]KAJ4344512.1 hypothetical protein N0V89_012255 [Didymosphaeria variabile]
MAGQKRPYYNDYGAYRAPRTLPNGGHVSSQASSQSRPSKSARTSYNSQPAHAAPGSSQYDPFVIDDEDDQDDGSQEVQDSSQSFGEIESYVLYGVISTKIVGVRFYSGHATLGEIAIPRREPNNQYDRNAIQVLNVNREQIGHIPRTQAAKLAPFMDRHSLIIEATISGRKEYYECPLMLRIYGPSDPNTRQMLIDNMRSAGLPTSSWKDVTQLQKKETQRQKERQKIAAQAAKRAKKQGGAVVVIGGGQQYGGGLAEYAAGSSQGVEPGPTLEDIIGGSERFNPRNAEQFVEEFGIKESDLAAMPKAAQPKALSTELHDFQLQGLHWLLEKESPKLPAEGTKDVVQLWQPHSTIRGAFTNLATNFSVTKPVLASGGILADDMGLGKTIQIISLIMADRQLGRRATDVCNATLILAPVSVMSNWSTQIKKHIKEEHALRVMFYHGNRKEPITPKSIGNFDVVISTYDSVSSEWHSQKSTTVPRKSGVFSVKWRRVILDEGHNIRNPKAKKTVAATNLMAQSRWALTGTPIINNLKDLFSLVRFLGLSGGLDSLEIFHAAIMRPVMAGDACGSRALQMLMAGICLRRKKGMSFIDLRLPDLAEYVHKVTLLPHEQEKYDAFEAQAKGTLDLYRKKAGGRDASDTYRHLLEVLLRMRQLCNHWKMISEERIDSIMKQLEAEGIVDLTEENKSALQNILQLSIDSQEDCPICLDSYKDPIITKCAHIFCTACIERVIETQHKCPMCRAELDTLATTTVKPAKDLAAPLPPTQEQLADKDSLENNASSKVNALMSILKASAQDTTNKTIVFSQWTTFLTLLEPHLRAAGMTYTRIDGSMPATARDAALDTFDTSPTCTIMLASLSVCSVGLNLIAANQVILSDSWWAPAIEDQAVDRVHRLGQKRETKVFRLVVEGSIEERVLGIQEDKRKLMGLAFAEKEGGKRRRAAGVADLERLLGTQPRRR